MIKIDKLNPFGRMCLSMGMIPSSYAESLTYEEQLIWFCNFLEKEVIPAVNKEGEAIEELQTLYIELKSYVDNYFDNLDIQSEVNNKLDDMAESGQLTDIIAQYLGLAGVLAYNTIGDMSDALNITNGSICYCLGDDTYNDGKGGFYKVRTVTVDDTIDGYYIVALDVSNTLIAERMPNYYINSLRNSVNNLNKNMTLLTNKKIIVIGDSYSKHEFEDITKFWYESFAQYLGLTLNTDLYVKASDGAGFYNDHFYNRLYELRNMENADLVTDILVVGGLNDRGKEKADLLTKMNDFKTLATTYFPNAKISLMYVGNTNPKIRQSTENRVGVIQSIMYYQENAGKLGMKFIKNCEYILHNYDADYWEDDGAHPSQLGQDLLGIYLTNAYLNGVCNVELFTDSYYVTAVASGRATAISNVNFTSGISNEYCYLKKAGDDSLYFTMDSSNVNCNGTTAIELATLTKGYFMGNGTLSATIVPIIVQGTIGGVANTRAIGTGFLYMEYGKLYLTPLVYHNNSSVNTVLDYIFVSPFIINVPSYYA